MICFLCFLKGSHCCFCKRNWALFTLMSGPPEKLFVYFLLQHEIEPIDHRITEWKKTSCVLWRKNIIIQYYLTECTQNTQMVTSIGVAQSCERWIILFWYTYRVFHSKECKFDRIFTRKKILLMEKIFCCNMKTILSIL